MSQGGKTSPTCLAYSVPPSVVKKVLSAEYVAIFKLLPGYMSSVQQPNATLFDNCNVLLSSGSADKEKRLDRQAMDIGQLVFGLMKFRDIVETLYPERGAQVGMYICNIVNLSVRYTGNVFFTYHQYLWEEMFSGYGGFESRNWSVIDSEALHAAISRAQLSANHCTLCPSWDHAEIACPFNVRDQFPTPRSPPKGQAQLAAATGKIRYCEFFNYSTGCARARCKFPHVCSHCGSSTHGINACRSAPASAKV